MRPMPSRLLILMFVLGAPAVGNSAQLPDYLTAEKREFVWLCDAEATRIHTDLYRASAYYVSVSGTETGPTFMSVYYSAEGRAQFLAKPTGSPDFVELPRETWQERIKVEMSPNYFKRIRNMENDCRCIIGCD